MRSFRYRGGVPSLCAAALSLAAPALLHADIVRFVFTSPAQSIASGAVSEPLSVQAQDGNGASQTIPQTGCLKLETTSGSGQFSSSASNWSAVVALTMNSGTANRTFYYKDSTPGTYTLTVKAALRPTGESRTCATLLSDGEFPAIQWSASQSITVQGGTAPQAADTGSTSTQSTTSTSQTNTTPPSAPVSSYVAPPDPSVYVDAGEDRTVIVGAHTTYRARAYNKKKEAVDNVRLNWNFGDGTTAEGASVTHHYEYPGKYIVVLSAAKDTESASDRIIVTAEPARLAFMTESDGSVVIGNHAGRDLDLSSWIVRAFMREFSLPDNTLILSGASLRISPKTLGYFAGAEAELAYPNGVLAMKAGDVPAQNIAPATVANAEQVVPRAAAVSRAAELPIKVSVAAADEESADTEFERAPAESERSAAAVSASFSGSYWWFAPLVLAFLAGGAMMIVHAKRKSEWDIIEDSQ